MIPERSLDVLRAIVQDYIASSEPVGSKALVERHSFGVSAATIRNDMAILEEEQLITAPHTSSGRVPTDKGYRLFVDRLNQVKPLSVAEKQAIESFMSGSADLDEVLGKTVRLLSQLTHQVAMVQYPSLQQANIRKFELIELSDSQLLMILVTDTGRIQQHLIDLQVQFDPEFVQQLRSKLTVLLNGLPLTEVTPKLSGFEGNFARENQPLVAKVLGDLQVLVDSNRTDKMIMAGTSNLIKREQDFRGQLTPVLDAIEEQVILLRLISEMQTDDRGVSLGIGSENLAPGLGSASIVVSSYENAAGGVAKVGVIGPTRMDYGSNIATVTAVSRYLSKILGG